VFWGACRGRNRRPRRRRAVVARADLNTQLVIGASTVAALAVGRFAFLGQQRGRVSQADAVGPKSTGTTYFDKLSQDASFIKSTGDPEGFGIISTCSRGARSATPGLPFWRRSRAARAGFD
jgi:photosystem I subunit V